MFDGVGVSAVNALSNGAGALKRVQVYFQRLIAASLRAVKVIASVTPDETVTTTTSFRSDIFEGNTNIDLTHCAAFQENGVCYQTGQIGLTANRPILPEGPPLLEGGLYFCGYLNAIAKSSMMFFT